MQRTELCFRDLHERLTYIEERQVSQGPTDEQVERILRKILAEKFSNQVPQPAESSTSRGDGGYYVEDRKHVPYPRSIAIDPASLIVDPDSVPSKIYVETFQMLEGRLAGFPHVNPRHSSEEDMKDMKMNIGVRNIMSPDSV